MGLQLTPANVSASTEITMDHLPDPLRNLNSAVQRSISGPPPYLSQRSRDRLSLLHNRAQIGLPANEVDREELAALGRRREVVGASLAHRDTNAVGDALTTMFLVMKVPQGQEGEWDLIVAAYQATLRDLPAWAVVEACQKAAEGQAIGGKTFAPTSPELRAMVERILEPVHREVAQLGTVIAAAADPGPPEPTPEERETTAQKIGAMLADMKAEQAKEKAKERELSLAQVQRANDVNAERMVEEAEAAGVEPFGDAEKKIPVSLSLRKLLQQQVEDDAMLQAATDQARERLNVTSHA
jgi:hypothetical protein